MDYTKPKRQLLTHHAPPSPPQTPLPLPLPTKLSSFKSWKAARSSSIPIKLPPRPPPTTRSVSTPTPTITPIGASSREPKPKFKPKSPKRSSSPEREYTPDIDADVGTSTSASTSTSPPDRPTLLREKQATDWEIFNRVLREHREARERVIVSRGAWSLEEDLMREGLEGQIEGLRREVERLGMGMGMSMNMDGVDDQEEAEEEAEEEHERFIHKEEFKAPSQTGERLSLDFEYAGSESEPESESEGSEAGSDRTFSHREHETEEQALSTKDADVKANVSAVESTALETMPSPGEGASSPDDGDDLVELSVSASEFEPGSIDAPTLNPDSKIECSAPTMIDLLFPTAPSTSRIPQNKEIWERDYDPDSDTDTDADADSDTDSDTEKDKPPEEKEEGEGEEQPPIEIWEHTQSDSPNHDHDPHETIHLYSIMTTSLIFAITSWIWFGLV